MASRFEMISALVRRLAAARLPRPVGVAVNAALVATLAFAAFIAYGLIDNRWYHVVVVQGGSMQPTIEPGDLIVITPPPPQIVAGMILTFEVDGYVVTHRVVEVAADGTFVTKGDANDARDDFSGNNVRVVGQYQFRIPRIGGLLSLDAPGADRSGAWFAQRQNLDGSASAGTAWDDPSPVPDEIQAVP
jgi:signal peptidase I